MNLEKENDVFSFSEYRFIKQLRAERFNRPEHRSILSVETITLYNKLKEAIKTVNKLFSDTNIGDARRDFRELLAYVDQYQADIDLLMCQMQYEPKVKETIVFAPVTTDILDRMNLILQYVRKLAREISSNDKITEKPSKENIIESDVSSLPSRVFYLIKIKTNDHAGSSLSNETNVVMKLHGLMNKSTDIYLDQSINSTKWQPGQIDVFNIEMVYLGDLYAIEIGHDSEFSSWKVDWIDIIDDGGNLFRFPIGQTFDERSNEKKSRYIFQRDFGRVSQLPNKPMKRIRTYQQIGFTTYKVQVKTGKRISRATDSIITLQLKGEYGSFSGENREISDRIRCK